MTRQPLGEYLLTPFECGEDAPWRKLPSEATQQAKAVVLARFLREGTWGPHADEAAIFPHVMAQDIERAFKAVDSDGCVYFVLTVGNDQLASERARRRTSREAELEESARAFHISPSECYERTRKLLGELE